MQMSFGVFDAAQCPSSCAVRLHLLVLSFMHSVSERNSESETLIVNNQADTRSVTISTVLLQPMAFEIGTYFEFFGEPEIFNV